MLPKEGKRWRNLIWLGLQPSLMRAVELKLVDPRPPIPAAGCTGTNGARRCQKDLRCQRKISKGPTSIDGIGPSCQTDVRYVKKHIYLSFYLSFYLSYLSIRNSKTKMNKEDRKQRLVLGHNVFPLTLRIFAISNRNFLASRRTSPAGSTG